MSTRCNVVIKKTVNEAINQVQLYHHHDGYPEGVGTDLARYFEEIMSDDKLSKKVLKSPTSLGKWLSSDDRNDEYKFEDGEIFLHGDIEYLYLIDMDAESITCYSVTGWDSSFTDIITEKSGKMLYISRFSTPADDMEKICDSINYDED